jgi:hypothetical protein
MAIIYGGDTALPDQAANNTAARNRYTGGAIFNIPISVIKSNQSTSTLGAFAPDGTGDITSVGTSPIGLT